MKFDWKRLLLPLALLAGGLVSLAAISGLFGGASGFLWVLRHGAAGPLAVILLHQGSLQPSSLVLAAVILGGMMVRGFSKKWWSLVVSLISAFLWVFVGLGVGV